jgi:hypothetical protein
MNKKNFVFIIFPSPFIKIRKQNDLPSFEEYVLKKDLKI